MKTLYRAPSGQVENKGTMIMKHINIISLLAFVLLCSCGKDIRNEIPSPQDRMQLKASTAAVEVSFYNMQAEVVTFSWEKSGYEAEGLSCRYWFKMDKAGNNFEDAICRLDVSGRNTLSFTGSELAEFIKDWDVMDGTTVKVEAEIIAEPEESGDLTTDKYRMPEVSKIEFDLLNITTAYLNVGNTKYAFVDNMVYAEVAAGTYSCTAGESFSSSVTVDKGGLWLFSLDIGTMTVNALRPQLWLLGSASPTGWVLEQMQEFSSDESGAVKTWEGKLQPGELKFALEKNSNWNFDINYLMPVSASVQALDSEVRFVRAHSGIDNKWAVYHDGDCRISVDMEKMKVTFEWSNVTAKWTDVWMTGSATQAEWNTPFSLKLVQDETIMHYVGVFVITTHIKPGEFKFPLSADNWFGPFLVPAEVGGDNLALFPGDGGSSRIKYVVNGAEEDKKWVVRDWQNAEGEYRIIVDTQQMKMTVYKQ